MRPKPCPVRKRSSLIKRKEKRSQDITETSIINSLSTLLADRPITKTNWPLKRKKMNIIWPKSEYTVHYDLCIQCSIDWEHAPGFSLCFYLAFIFLPLPKPILAARLPVWWMSASNIQLIISSTPIKWMSGHGAIQNIISHINHAPLFIHSRRISWQNEFTAKQPFLFALFLCKQPLCILHSSSSLRCNYHNRV